MADFSKLLGLLALVIIAALVIGIGAYVTGYMQSNTEDITGVWNGTVMYDDKYYDSRFMFYNDSTCTILLYPKAGLTYNLSQPTTEPVVRDHVTWEQEGDHFNLIYSGGDKVRLDYTDVSRVLRFNETARDGYKTPYMGYISENRNYLTEFGDIYNSLRY